VLVLVSYDVSTTTRAGKKRLSQVSKACKDYGMRVQFSVFECEVDPAQWERLRSRLLSIVEPVEDSLRFYFMGSNWERRVEHHGLQKAPDIHGLLTV
jgi:CRISPR-associated protein Cas2